jgi:hypothetical protein
MDDAEHDVLAYMTFPEQHSGQIAFHKSTGNA